MSFRAEAHLGVVLHIVVRLHSSSSGVRKRGGAYVLTGCGGALGNDLPYTTAIKINWYACRPLLRLIRETVCMMEESPCLCRRIGQERTVLNGARWEIQLIPPFSYSVKQHNMNSVASLTATNDKNLCL